MEKLLASARPIGATMLMTVVSASGAWAHHSFAMFDGDNPITIRGTVVEYKCINPHAFITIQVADDKGSVTNWILEGASAASLIRDGWSSRSLKAGDELILKVAPLRSGAPGGAWDTKDTKFSDDRPIVNR